MRLGACDYVPKGRIAELRPAIRRGLEIDRRRRHARATESRFRRMVEHLPAINFIVGMGADAAVTYVSPRISALVGFADDELVADATQWLALVHPDDHERVREEIAASERFVVPLATEYRMVARDGRVVWVRDERVPVRDGFAGALTWQGILLDVTERKALEAQLMHQAFHDGLTGLPNRALFHDRVAHARSRAMRFRQGIAVLFIDLDGFKQVNDRFGHAVGDRLLAAVGERLRLAVRESDTAARYGGDEFTVLLEDIERAEDAAEVALRVIAAFRSPFPIDGQTIVISPSVGAAFTQDGGAGADALLQAADTAMYRAKRRAHAGVEVIEVGSRE
jgi:diguanylate cyclase (GGDEF)-like protein/PAS domain S-box-containing protein